MMTEPIDNKSHAKPDRICEAMIAIRAEIEQDRAVRADDQLKRALLTTNLLLDEWTRPYGKEQAFYPVPAVKEGKYWAPAGRADNAYSDRHLVCTRPPIEAYQQAVGLIAEKLLFHSDHQRDANMS